MIVQINIKYQYNFYFVPLKTIPCISFRGSKAQKKGALQQGHSALILVGLFLYTTF